jgi:hypothetical protein
MSSASERQAGTSGSTMGYEQGQAQGQAGGQAQGQQGQLGDQMSDQGRMSGQGQMTAQAQGRDYPATGRDYQAGGRHATDNRGAVIGFTALAGTLMLLSGLWMVVVAIVALSHGHVFSTAPTYAFRYNIRGWGWTELALGVVIFAAGMCVFLGMAWARYVGAFLAVLSAIASFVFIPYQPLWSIVMIALDAFIIWALLTPRRYASEF